LAFVTDDGRQYVVAGPWRRRSDIAEILEVSNGKHRVLLLNAVSSALTAHGFRLLVLDYGLQMVDEDLYRDAGLAVVERIVEYERPDCRGVTQFPRREVRPYTPADRDAVLDVERESFSWLWWNSTEEWESYVSTPGVDVIVAVDHERIVGYAGTTIHHRDGHLDRLAVRQSHQGRGFGATLLAETLIRLDRAGARRVRLTTQENNFRSQALYERYGFRRGRWTYTIYGKWLEQPEGS
jgi:ribosomal-protein-alanine N-acetyltransferase